MTKDEFIQQYVIHHECPIGDAVQTAERMERRGILFDREGSQNALLWQVKEQLDAIRECLISLRTGEKGEPDAPMNRIADILGSIAIDTQLYVNGDN